MVFAGFASAQSFTFEHNGETVEPGTYEVIGDIDPNTWDMFFEFTIHNLTVNDINVKCDRVILEQSHDEAQNSVCMGVDCFAPHLDHTYADIPGYSEKEFSAHFTPALDESYNPIEGCSMKVQYSFYDSLMYLQTALYLQYTPPSGPEKHKAHCLLPDIRSHRSLHPEQPLGYDNSD